MSGVEFERNLSAWLEETAPIGPPDGLREAVDAELSRRRAMPALLALLTERAMRRSGRVVVGSPAVRAAYVAAIMLLLAVGAAAALIVASRLLPPPTQPLPPPFGLAANGVIAYADEGGIFTVDPRTGGMATVVASPGSFGRPTFSRDGTRVAFSRAEDRSGLLFVSRPDGSGLIQLTRERLDEFGPYHDPYVFSPDGQTILGMALIDNAMTMIMIPATGEGPIRSIPVDLHVEGPLTYRPPNGSEILFVGSPLDGVKRGLYALDPTTAVVRTILGPTPSAEMCCAEWSPDGSRIAYEIDGHVHVIEADGSGDFRLDHHPDAISEGGARWSNDGSRLVIRRVYGANGSDHLGAVVPADGANVGVEIACPGPASNSSGFGCDWWEWSPDDSLIVGARFDARGSATEQVFVDPETGGVRLVPWTGDGPISWQRLAL